MGAILKKMAVFLKENALCPVELLCPPSLISKSTIFDFERRDGGYDFRAPISYFKIENC